MINLLKDQGEDPNRYLTDEQKEAFKPAAIEMKRGEASFHHPMIVHGSYENRSDRSRRAMVINAVQDGVCSDTDEPLPTGEVGEILVRPKEPFCFMQGYNGMPDRTVETWRNFWFHTGDAGRLDERVDLEVALPAGGFRRST